MRVRLVALEATVNDYRNLDQSYFIDDIIEVAECCKRNVHIFFSKYIQKEFESVVLKNDDVFEKASSLLSESSLNVTKLWLDVNFEQMNPKYYCTLYRLICYLLPLIQNFPNPLGKDSDFDLFL